MNQDFLDPNMSRATVYETPEGLRIVVPARRRILIALFLSFWLCGWAFGWIAAFTTLASGSAGSGGLFLIFWLCAWTVGGMFAISFVAWMLAGKEVVTVTSQGIEIARKIGVFQRNRSCKADYITDLRAVDEAPSTSFGRSQPPWILSGFRHGSVKFDYGNLTLGFGLELERGEARKISGLLAERFAYLQSR